MNRIVFIPSLRSALWQFAVLAALCWAVVLGLSLPMPTSAAAWFYWSVLAPLGMAALLAWREGQWATVIPRRRRHVWRAASRGLKSSRGPRSNPAPRPLRHPA